LLPASIIHNVKWKENRKNDTTKQLFTNYIADGSFATPPQGFVQKTGYFVGYRIIEACVNQGLTLEQICALNSKAVIDESKYFE
jgi:uncharacterized protein YjaZ